MMMILLATPTCHAKALASAEVKRSAHRSPMPRLRDPLSTAARSERMSRVRSKHTKPELRVRRLVFALGFRYRLHVANLPCTPDLVFRGRKKIILVHGCFWHRHQHNGCRLARLPRSRLGFWLPKLEANRARDSRNVSKLRRLGWSVMTVWECQLGRPGLERRVRRFLEGQPTSNSPIGDSDGSAMLAFRKRGP
jgi:DNA mismatch endonuclease (patch repair protein)